MLVSNYVTIPQGKNTYMTGFTLFLPRAFLRWKWASQHPAEVPVALQQRPPPALLVGQESAEQPCPTDTAGCSTAPSSARPETAAGVHCKETVLVGLEQIHRSAAL